MAGDPSPVELAVEVAYDERYFYPDDGGILWLAGFQPVDPVTGRYLGRDAPELASRGIHVASVAGAGRFHADVLDREAFTPGRPLALARDRENEHDPNAIRVLAADASTQAGWVPRDLAAELAPALDAGRPVAALVLRESRPSPRDPRTGLTMLVARAERIVLREQPRR